MSHPDIKEVVKQKYGQAALRVTSGGSSCCGATASTGAVTQLPLTSTTRCRPAKSPKRLCWLRSAAATPPRWPN